MYRVCLYVVFMTVSVCMCLNIFVCVLCVSRVYVFHECMSVCVCLYVSG